MADISLTEPGHPRQIGLRAAPGSPATERLEALLGCQLPLQPNTSAAGVLWLGPDEWLIVDRDVTERELRDALAGGGAAVELSANRTALVLAGARARDVLASCCSIDLHPSRFAPGSCVQTLVAGVDAILEQLDAAPSFRLLVRPSFVAHVRAWLQDSINAL